MTMIGKPRSATRASGVELEIERRGKGDPLLVLYGEGALELQSPLLGALAKTHELIIPSPPVFGRSERPDWISDPDDVAYISLDLVEQLGVMRVPCAGLLARRPDLQIRELPRTKPLSTQEPTE